MKRACRPFQSSVAGLLEDFLRHHRALGKRFDTEERALRLFDQYLLEQGVQQLADISPALLQAFLNSRPRCGSAAAMEPVVSASATAWRVAFARATPSPNRHSNPLPV
jgi:hypothetical protein